MPHTVRVELDPIAREILFGIIDTARQSAQYT